MLPIKDQVSAYVILWMLLALLVLLWQEEDLGVDLGVGRGIFTLSLLFDYTVCAPDLSYSNQIIF